MRMVENIVEIPEGSCNYYRYVYNQGQTVYLGPVGDSPPISEEEFLSMSVLGVEDPIQSREEEIEFILRESKIPRTDQTTIMARRIVDFANEARTYHGVQVSTHDLVDWASRSRRWTIYDSFIASVYQKYGGEEQEIIEEVYNNHFPSMID